MRNKYINIAIMIFVLLFLFVFRNITYTFISNIGIIDKHTLSVMVQGAISPTKEFVLERNSIKIAIILPGGAAELERNTYLVPMSRFMGYLEILEEKKGYTVERLGSFISVQSDEGHVFHISVRPYMGAYMRLEYSLLR